MLFLSFIFFKYGEISAVKSIFEGLNIIVLVLLCETVRTVVLPASKNLVLFLFVFISFLLKVVFSLNFIILILLNLSFGFIYEYKFKKEFEDKKNKFEFKVSLKNIIIPLIFISIFILSIIFKNKSELIKLFFNMTKSGFLAFGGGIAAISVIKEIIVEQNQILNEKEFLSALILSQMTPGPILNISVFIGYKVYGIFGALISGVGMFTPGLILMNLFSVFSKSVSESKVFKIILRYILTAFNGIIIYVVFDIGKNLIIDKKYFLFFVFSYIIKLIFKLKPIQLILLALICSYFYFT